MKLELTISVKHTTSYDLVFNTLKQEGLDDILKEVTLPGRHRDHHAKVILSIAANNMHLSGGWLREWADSLDRAVEVLKPYTL